MARAADRLPENAPGEFYVDRSCIDCDTCRQLAPSVFVRADGPEQSVVGHQPVGEAERRRAALALVACPTSSIGGATPDEVRAAARAFPEPLAEDLYYCGYAAASSFGASSYLLRRSDGNWLVDSPRAARPLVARLDELGGVAHLFLSHRDDVADHAELHARFGCARVIHRADLPAVGSAERVVDGDAPVALAPGVTAIPVPGHTRGSMALLVDDRYLFTGDHLWGSESRGGLHMSRSVCWHSWPEQLRSLRRLLDFRFEWILPGHGRRWRAPSATAMHAEIERLLKRLA
jgi:glyoxylase-like metal-dependent hydrolase (beta-lactamase superfamily II)/ferredoxin